MIFHGSSPKKKRKKRPAVPINSMISMPFPTSNAIQCPILLSLNRLAHGIFRCFLLVGFNPTILGQKLVIIPKCYKFTKKNSMKNSLASSVFGLLAPSKTKIPIGPSCHSPDAVGASRSFASDVKDCEPVGFLPGGTLNS